MHFAADDHAELAQPRLISLRPNQPQLEARAKSANVEAGGGFALKEQEEEQTFQSYGSEVEAAARVRLDKTLTMSSFDQDPMARATAFMELAALQFEEATKVLAGTNGVPA